MIQEDADMTVEGEVEQVAVELFDHACVHESNPKLKYSCRKCRREILLAFAQRQRKPKKGQPIFCRGAADHQKTVEWNLQQERLATARRCVKLVQRGCNDTGKDCLTHDCRENVCDAIRTEFGLTG